MIEEIDKNVARLLKPFVEKCLDNDEKYTVHYAEQELEAKAMALLQKFKASEKERPKLFNIIKEMGRVSITQFSEHIKELEAAFRVTPMMREHAYRGDSHGEEETASSKILTAHDATDLAWMVLQGADIDEDLPEQGLYFQLQFLLGDISEEVEVKATLNGEVVEVDEVESAGGLLVVHLFREAGFPEKLESCISWGSDNPLELLIELNSLAQ